MWTTVLALAIAVNFDPTRIAFILVVLSRPRPIVQLAAYLSGGVLMSAAVGILIVFVVHRGLFSIPEFDGATVQVVVGIVALLVAALLATNISMKRSRSKVAVGGTSSAGEPPSPDPGQPLSTFAATRFRGRSLGTAPWVSGVMGVSTALPSVEYMALLVLIGASGITPWAKALTLGIYLLIANVVSAVPLISYAVVPEMTRSALSSFHCWIRTRRRRDFAIVLAVAGGAMTAVGIAGL